MEMFPLSPEPARLEVQAENQKIEILLGEVEQLREEISLLKEEFKRFKSQFE
jgi:uncharacterized small protein (DUF1192 family)